MVSVIKYITLFLLTLALACTPSGKNEADLSTTQKNDPLRDSVESRLVQTIEEINQNLDLIREKEGLINSAENAENLSKKEAILRNISLINVLLDENKKKMIELISQANQLGRENSALVRISKQTQERIEKQEHEIINLKQDLAMEEYKVADLYNKMDEMQVANEVLLSEKNALLDANDQLSKDLNKGYFVYGTREQLVKKEIIEKKGGLLGIGKENALANAFFKNREYFVELDMRDIKTVPIQGKKPKLLTQHPVGSYEWKQKNEEYTSLIITNPQEFWFTSRFLVIEVRE
ncbi:MAG: hypothetical protein PSX36_12065 [bacterium]|nr:hypothetical protein [bacterium]